jgi:hypothetical protein
MLVTVSSEVVKGWVSKAIPYYKDSRKGSLDRNEPSGEKFYCEILDMCWFVDNLANVATSFTFNEKEIIRLTVGRSFF